MPEHLIQEKTLKETGSMCGSQPEAPLRVSEDNGCGCTSTQAADNSTVAMPQVPTYDQRATMARFADLMGVTAHTIIMDEVSAPADEFAAILRPLEELLRRKNHDYGDSYAQLRSKYGFVSFLLRVEDKLNRSSVLDSSAAQVSDESIEDTLKDIIGYCTLELRYRGRCEL